MMHAHECTKTTVSRAVPALSGKQAVERETGCPVLTVHGELVRR